MIKQVVARVIIKIGNEDVRRRSKEKRFTRKQNPDENTDGHHSDEGNPSEGPSGDETTRGERAGLYDRLPGGETLPAQNAVQIRFQLSGGFVPLVAVLFQQSSNDPFEVR